MPHTDCNSFEVVVPLFGNARSYYSGGEALAIPKVSLLMEGAGQQAKVKRSTLLTKNKVTLGLSHFMRWKPKKSSSVTKLWSSVTL